MFKQEIVNPKEKTTHVGNTVETFKSNHIEQLVIKRHCHPAHTMSLQRASTTTYTLAMYLQHLAPLQLTLKLAVLTISMAAMM